MRVAIPEHRGRVAPVFDSCQRIVLYDVADGRCVAVGAADLATFTTAMRVGILRAYGVSTLLCGAVSELAQGALNATGIEVHGFLCGDVSLLIRAYGKGDFNPQNYSMPGCKSL